MSAEALGWTLERNGDKLLAERTTRGHEVTVLVCGGYLRVVPRAGAAIMLPLAAVRALLAEAP